MITLNRLKELLRYDPETGDLIWIVNRRGKYGRIGVGAGTFAPEAIYVGLDGRIYLAHRLVWLITHEEWPKGQIDHIDGDPHNNRLSNLRDSTHAVNQQNRRKPQCNNNTGVLGVTRYGDRFYTQINKGGKNYDLGHYATLEEASEVYLKKKRELHEGCTL